MKSKTNYIFHFPIRVNLKKLVDQKKKKFEVFHPTLPNVIYLTMDPT